MKLLSSAALIAGVIGLASSPPVRAEGVDGPARYAPGAPRHLHHRRHARILPPEVPYRDPRVSLRPHAQPDFLVHAYLPRRTELPMYNEPPARFPQR